MSEKELSVAGTDWTLIRYGDKELPEAVSVTFMYDPEQGRIAGRSGCNRYFGPATMGKEKMEVGVLAGTRRMCPPPMMEVEAAFLKMLQTAGTYSIDNDRLVIDCAGDQQLVFQPAAG